MSLMTESTPLTKEGGAMASKVAKLNESQSGALPSRISPDERETAPSTNKISRIVLLGRRGAEAADR